MQTIGNVDTENIRKCRCRERTTVKCLSMKPDNYRCYTVNSKMRTCTQWEFAVFIFVCFLIIALRCATHIALYIYFTNHPPWSQKNVFRCANNIVYLYTKCSPPDSRLSGKYNAKCMRTKTLHTQIYLVHEQ